MASLLDHFPLSSGGYQFAIVFTEGAHPIDWKYPFNPHKRNASQINSNATPINKFITEETIKPIAINFLAPTLSPRKPLINCPDAYARKKVVPISPITAGVIPNSVIKRGLAIERLARPI